MKLVEDFFNKLVIELDKKYFPNLKYYRDDKKCANVHYAVECFSNGVINYDSLIKKLSTNCNDSKENLETIVNKFIIDF